MNKGDLLYRLIHILFGAAVLIIFAYTGQVMDKEYAHLEGMEDLPRMAFRAGHIYILLSGVIHLVLGSFISWQRTRLLRVLQALGSLLLLTSTILFIYSWFTELPASDIERPMAREGVWMALRGGVVLGIVGVVSLFPKK